METYTNKPTTDADIRILDIYSTIRRGQGRRGSRQFATAESKAVWREVLQIAERKHNGAHWNAIEEWAKLAAESNVTDRTGFFKYMRGCAKRDKGPAHGLIVVNPPTEDVEVDYDFF